MARFTRVVPPGEEGEIIAVLQTDKYQGPITKSVVVRTNDPGQPAVTLQLKVDIQTYLEVVPSWQAAFNASLHKPAQLVLYLRQKEKDPDFQIVGAMSSNQHVSPRVEKIGADDPDARQGDFRLILDLDDKAPLGPLTGDVTLSTTDRRQNVVRVPITGKVNGPILYFPVNVVMFSDASGVPPRLGGTIILQARPDSPAFQVTAQEADDPRLALVPGPGPNGRSFRIGVSWTDPEAKGLHEGKIRIVTDSPEMAEIEVPYQVRIR